MSNIIVKNNRFVYLQKYFVLNFSAHIIHFNIYLKIENGI